MAAQRCSGQVSLSVILVCDGSYPLLGMSDALRKELTGTGVKVTNILPGVCNTPMFVRGAEQGMEKKEVEELGAKLIQPEDVGLIVWDAVGKPER